MSLRLLQYRDDNGGHRVVAADTDSAWFVPRSTRIVELAQEAISTGETLAARVSARGAGDRVDVRTALEERRLIAPVSHADPAHMILSGTGLTHLGSAEGRDKMHRDATAMETKTDSMRMFLDGVAGGKPGSGAVGQQPEWFFKGDGSCLVGPEQDLAMPSFALDGGEEPELAGIYLIGPDGSPFRIGICLANEFSDHVTERHNYLWLAHSKLRSAALGPELLLGRVPDHIEGTTRIRRNGEVLWEKPFLSGEANMSHTLANLEHHHFKYTQFRRPGDIHIHFFGTATLSFTDGVQTLENDVFEIETAPFDLPLRNRLVRSAPDSVTIRTL